MRQEHKQTVIAGAAGVVAGYGIKAWMNRDKNEKKNPKLLVLIFGSFVLATLARITFVDSASIIRWHSLSIAS